MVELRRHRRRLLVAGTAVAAVLLVVLGARALQVDDDSACQAPDAAPPAQIALMPPGLSFDQVGTVTRVRKAKRHLMVRAVTDKPLDVATVLIQDAVTAAGYRPAGMDNEGFEAEVFFQAGDYAAGQARLRWGGCEGRWDVDLVLIDLDDVPARSTA
jgi:hypothetical protein